MQIQKYTYGSLLKLLYFLSAVIFVLTKHFFLKLDWKSLFNRISLTLYSLTFKLSILIVKILLFFKENF